MSRIGLVPGVVCALVAAVAATIGIVVAAGSPETVERAEYVVPVGTLDPALLERRGYGNASAELAADLARLDQSIIESITDLRVDLTPVADQALLRIRVEGNDRARVAARAVEVADQLRRRLEAARTRTEERAAAIVADTARRLVREELALGPEATIAERAEVGAARRLGVIRSQLAATEASEAARTEPAVRIDSTTPPVLTTESRVDLRAVALAVGLFAVAAAAGARATRTLRGRRRHG